MRSLEKQIEKITRKIAFEAVGDEESSDLESSAPSGVSSDASSDVDSESKIVIKDQRSLIITAENLEKYVGKAKFTQVRKEKTSLKSNLDFTVGGAVVVVVVGYHLRWR